MPDDEFSAYLDPPWWGEDPSTIEGYLRGEMMLAFDREVATTVEGPALYGDGNGGGFDVILVPFKTWRAVPRD